MNQKQHSIMRNYKLIIQSLWSWRILYGCPQERNISHNRRIHFKKIRLQDGIIIKNDSSSKMTAKIRNGRSRPFENKCLNQNCKRCFYFGLECSDLKNVQNGKICNLNPNSQNANTLNTKGALAKSIVRYFCNYLTTCKC